MVAWLAVAALLAVVAAQVHFDRKLWGTALTPGVLLMSGYFIVVLLFTAAASAQDLEPLALGTYLVLALLGILCVVASGVVGIHLAWKRRDLHTRCHPSSRNLRALLALVALSFAWLAFDRAQAAGGLWTSESIETLSRGVVGHLHVLLAFLAILYAVSTSDAPSLRNGLLLLALAAMSLYPVKGWTLIPAVAIALALALRGSRRSESSILPLVLAGVLGLLLFFGIYLSRAWGEGLSADVFMDIAGEVAQHLLFYLTAGVVGLDGVLRGINLNGDATVLFAPFLNGVALLTGDDYVSVISDVFVPSPLGHPTGGNVFSILGTAIGYAGPFVGLALVVLIVAVAYLLFGLAWRSSQPALRVAALYLCSTLAFGWFDYYLSQLTPFEVVVYSLVAVAMSLPLARPRARLAP